MNKRVFVVDDDPVIRQLLLAVLKSDGYDVEVAVDGTEGISRFAAVKPDIVLLDAMMPGADGLEVCRAIRGDQGVAVQPYVILLTAAAAGFPAQQAVEAGADEVMSKPFSPMQLLARLREVRP